jgi:hypothetical protein
LLVAFARGPYCLWWPKISWSPPLGASDTLKIDKNGLEARKLQPFKVGAESFLQKILIFSAHNLFSNPSKKILKYYSVAFRVTR